MLDDTKLKNCGLRNASKFPLNENVNFNEPMILCDESYGRNLVLVQYQINLRYSISFNMYISKSHQ